MEKQVLKHFKMFLRAGSIESGPPLSTILGNYGVNTVKFCDDFNSYTKDLPNYFVLKTNIIIYGDKTFEFNIFLPSTSSFLRMVAKEDFIFVKGMGGFKKKSIQVVYIKDFLEIGYLKFGYLNNKIINMLLGTVRSMNLFIKWDIDVKKEER